MTELMGHTLENKLGEGQLIFWYLVHPQAFFEESGDGKIKKKSKNILGVGLQ